MFVLNGYGTLSLSNQNSARHIDMNSDFGMKILGNYKLD